MSELITKSDTSEKRDDIIRQAFGVFYKEGFHASGVDSLLKGTGISKRTLYKHFESKEDLIRSTVEFYQGTALKSIRDFIANKPARSATDRALLIFDWLEDVLASGHELGCYAMNAKLEYANKDQKIEAVCDTYFANLESELTDLCRDAKIKELKKTVHQVLILFQGAIVNGRVTKDPQSARLAKAAARLVLENQGG